jgi:hypothetical protein
MVGKQSARSRKALRTAGDDENIHPGRTAQGQPDLGSGKIFESAVSAFEGTLQPLFVYKQQPDSNQQDDPRDIYLDSWWGRAAVEAARYRRSSEAGQGGSPTLRIPGRTSPFPR